MAFLFPMRMTPRHARPALSVALVSSNPETAVEAYLRRAGVTVVASRDLDRAVETAALSAAVVVFADDFGLEAVASAASRIRARQPTLLLAIVTGDPAAASGRPSLADAVVLPKPAWGWTILDAIRARLEPAREAAAFVQRLGRLLSWRP